MKRVESEGWIILKTAGRSTLRLAASLAEDGFDVWAPSVVRRIRIPRANARREVTMPLLPTFVFARARHLDDLLEITNSDRLRRGCGGRDPAHPEFRVFRHSDRIPVIEDASMEPLRREAARAVPTRQHKEYQQGQSVRLSSGIGAGMIGKVVNSHGRYTLVCFGGSMRMKIPTFNLTLDDDIKEPARKGPAAEAA